MSDPRAYDSPDSSDDDNTPRNSHSLLATQQPPSLFLFPPSRRGSASSTASNTPLPSRSTSPLPQFYPPHQSSSCPSDSDSEPSSPLLRNHVRNPWLRNDRSRWWSIDSSRRRRKRSGSTLRVLKRWLRRLVLSLILLSVFAISLTLLLIYVLNPDHDPLPWRAYCSVPSLAPPFDRPAPPNLPHLYPNFTDGHPFPVFPPPHFDDLPPAGVFVGVFSIDSGFERRMLIRTTWASHPRSRDGAAPGDNGVGTSRTLVRFVMGQPRKNLERRVKLEMEMYNDIVILPMPENMNGGKTHTFFSWAAINAWVPPVYRPSVVPMPTFSYSNSTSTPPSLAPHDPFLAWSDITAGRSRPWVRPDYVIKVDDDSFVILAELEARLRVELHSTPRNNDTPRDGDSSPSSSAAATSSGSHSPPLTSTATSAVRRADPALSDPLIYWGYLVTNRLHIFMAGELYALSWSLVDWVARDPTVKTLTRGAEDKQTAKWMRAHPRASEVRWTSERCWIYDHPRSGTVYSHGFLFPSEATRVRRSMIAEQEKAKLAREALAAFGALGSPTSVVGGGTPPAWAHSSVSTFGMRYTPPLPELSSTHSVEALVEGSDMSLLREGSPMTPEYAWTHREGRKARYEGRRIGGTVVVHFIKKHMWYLETALALLEGEEQSEAERYESSRATLDAAEAAAAADGVSEAEAASRRHAQAAQRRSRGLHAGVY